MKSVDSRLYTLYPFLYAFYPVLALLALNIDQVNPITLLRPLIFSVVFSLAIWLVLSLLLRNLWKSGLLTIAIEVLFFSYGHELRLITGIPQIGSVLGNNLFLGTLDLGLLAILTFWIIRTKSSLYFISVLLTFTNLFLLAMPVFNIGYHYWGYQKPLSDIPVTGSQVVDPLASLDKPDVYFIVLDAYSRQDLMKADFNFDNQPFIDQLTNLGFQVIPCSRSNYNATSLSLSSMLNLDYETTMGVEASSVASGDNPMIPWIKNNQVRTTMEKMGYKIYTFENEFPGLDWPNTDKFVMPQQESWASQQLLPTETLFIKDTGLNFLLDSQIGVFNQLQKTVDSPYANHIKLVQYALNKLPGTASLTGPKFVYAHLILPHRPFVFDAQGNIRTDTGFFKNAGDPINENYYREGYIGQVEYANNQMSQILKEILQYSQKPPIIIMMGDHGYQAVDTRFENLMAVYLPGNPKTPFYSNISNVNVFRTIFNDYFGGKYDMLPDLSFRIDFKKGVYLVVPEVQPGCVNNPSGNK
jgi:hypothetical protein